MKHSIHRLKALTKKEFKDFFKNMNVSLMCILPIILVLLFVNMQKTNQSQDYDQFQVLNLGLSINLVFVSTFAISMLIAEEKEKNTLRTLMLSSVRPLEFLIGKAIVILTFSILSNAVIYMIVGLETVYLISYLLWTILVTFIMMLIGGILGLVAKSQMSTSILGLPVIFGFMIIPLFSQVNESFESLSKLLPNYNLNIILIQVINGQGYQNILASLTPIIIWTILAIFGFVYTYNKKRIDA